MKRVTFHSNIVFKYVFKKKAFYILVKINEHAVTTK